MSSLKQPETASAVDFLALEREATINHLLTIWSRIRALKQELLLEIEGIQGHNELTTNERATVKESVGAVSAALNIAEVDKALNSIEELLAAFYQQDWPEKPKQQVNQPTKLVELAKEIEEKIQKLEECIAIIDEFKALREKINQLAESIHASFPRPDDSGHAYRYHPGQRLHDSLKALHDSMKENMDIVLADIPVIVGELTDLMVAEL